MKKVIFDVTLDYKEYKDLWVQSYKDIASQKILKVNIIQLLFWIDLYQKDIYKSSEKYFYLMSENLLESNILEDETIEKVLRGIVSKKTFSKKVNASIAKKIFSKEYYIGTLEGYKVNPQFLVKLASAQTVNNSPIKKTDFTEHSSDGSIIIQKKDGVKVKLKSKIKELGKKPQAKNIKNSIEFNIPDLAIDIPEIPRGLPKKQMDSSNNHIESTPPKDININLYLDEETETIYLSISDFIVSIHKYLAKDTLNLLFTSEGKINQEIIIKLLKKYLSDGWEQCIQTIINQPKNYTFHTKEEGLVKTITLLEIEILPCDKMNQPIQGKILKKFKSNMIGERYTLKDIIKSKN